MSFSFNAKSHRWPAKVSHRGIRHCETGGFVCGDCHRLYVHVKRGFEVARTILARRSMRHDADVAARRLRSYITRGMNRGVQNRVNLWLKSERAFGLRSLPVRLQSRSNERSAPPGEPIARTPPSVPPP